MNISTLMLVIALASGTVIQAGVPFAITDYAFAIDKAVVTTVNNVATTANKNVVQPVLKNVAMVTVLTWGMMAAEKNRSRARSMYGHLSSEDLLFAHVMDRANDRDDFLRTTHIIDRYFKAGSRSFFRNQVDQLQILNHDEND